MNATLLYTVSFLTNAAVLIFEIAGGRLLAPYLGTAVGVWAGLISVVLGGMALGYHWGGERAVRDYSRATIGRLLFASGLAALIAWSVRDFIPTVFSAFGFPVTFSAIIVGTILFLPTVFLLAAVAPILVKNLVHTAEESPRAVGRLYAIGSLGSIVGAVATGSFLLPYISVSIVMLSVAIGLVLLSLLFLRSRPVAHLAIFTLVLIIALFLNAIPSRASVAVAEVSTNYNRVFIDRLRLPGEVYSISIDPFGIQCAMRKGSDGTFDEEDLVFEYVKAFDITRETFRPDGPRRALFLGGCNYSYPRYLLSKMPTLPVDVVEIDPGMTRIATDYFDFNLSAFPSLQVFHEDARTYLNKSSNTYDIIFMDTFGSAKGIPVHLTTEEMFQAVAKNLDSDGYLVVNGHGAYQGIRSELPSALLRTMKSVFPYVSVYHMGRNPNENQNLIFVASRVQPLPSKIDSTTFPDVTLYGVTLPDSPLILTDDFAPVERLMH